MCDYCGCRSRALIARLGDDHDALRSRLGDLRRALDRGEADVGSAAARLADLLETHSALEEAGLYPALDGAGIGTGELVAEHGAVDRAVRSAADGRLDREALRDALDALEQHIWREEYDLFPSAHQLLSDETWDRLDHQARPRDEP